MKKSYEEQCKDVWAKEAKKAESLGFESVAEYRQYLADENKKRTYLAKIARYEKAIAEMEEWLASHQPLLFPAGRIVKKLTKKISIQGLTNCVLSFIL